MFLKSQLDLKSLRVFHACITTTIGFIYISYIEGYPSPIEDTLLEKEILTLNTFSLFATANYFGAFIGSIFVGLISEYFGSKTCLVIFSQLGTFGALLQVLALDGVSMIMGRFLIGVYIAFCASCIPVYNRDVSPPSLNIFYGGILGVSLRVGTVLSYILGIWVGYRWLAVIIIAMLVFMNLNLVFLPESPKWLKKKGWTEKAVKANEYFYESNPETTPIIQIEIQTDNVLIPPNASFYKKVKSYFVWPVLRPLLVCSSIQFFKALSGQEYLLSYSAHTLKNVVNFNPKYAALFFAVFLLLGSIIFLWIIYKVQWKKLLLVTTFAQAFSNGLLSLSMYLYIHQFKCVHDAYSPSLCEVLQFAPLFLVGIYGFSFSIGWGSISWWLYGQILHPHYITVSAGIVSLVLYISTFINQLIGPIIAEYLGAYVLFLIYSVICFSALFFQLFY